MPDLPKDDYRSLEKHYVVLRKLLANLLELWIELWPLLHAEQSVSTYLTYILKKVNSAGKPHSWHVRRQIVDKQLGKPGGA